VLAWASVVTPPEPTQSTSASRVVELPRGERFAHPEQALSHPAEFFVAAMERFRL
jgi:hypothetical protein